MRRNFFPIILLFTMILLLISPVVISEVIRIRQSWDEAHYSGKIIEKRFVKEPFAIDKNGPYGEDIFEPLPSRYILFIDTENGIKTLYVTKEGYDYCEVGDFVTKKGNVPFDVKKQTVEK